MTSTEHGRPGHLRPSLIMLVVIGGMFGTTLRALIGLAIPTPTGGWPWATFLINVSGSFVLGFLLEAIVPLRPELRRKLQLTLGTGMLGGYTTYSSFAVETVSLFREGSLLAAVGYALGSVVLGFLAALGGTWLAGRFEHRRVVT